MTPNQESENQANKKVNFKRNLDMLLYLQRKVEYWYNLGCHTENYPFSEEFKNHYESFIEKWSPKDDD